MYRASDSAHLSVVVGLGTNLLQTGVMKNVFAWEFYGENSIYLLQGHVTKQIFKE